MDFKGMFQTWIRVLSSPGAEVFVAEKESAAAKLSTALLWMVLASIVWALLGLVQSQLAAATMGRTMDTTIEEMRAEMPEDIPPELVSFLESFFEIGPGLMGRISLGMIIIVPLFFLIGVGVYHVVASLLGGKGQLGRFAYLLATFSAPLTIANPLLGWIPIAGGCISLLVAVYGLALTYFAAKVEYGLSDGRAIIVVAAPFLLFVLLGLCALVVIFGVVMSAVQNTQ